MLAVAADRVPTARSGRWAGGWWALPAELALLDGPFVLAAPLGCSLVVTAVAATACVNLAALLLTTGRGTTDRGG